VILRLPDILRVHPREERVNDQLTRVRDTDPFLTHSAAFLKGDNKRVVGSGGDPWEADPRSTDWRAD
jgi:hypothetical protein